MADAKFLDFQRGEDGEMIPLFNVTREGHRLKGSTVTLATLKKEGLQPPPIFNENKKITIKAAVPVRLYEVILKKAHEEGIEAPDKAGQYIIEGIEAERRKNDK